MLTQTLIIQILISLILITLLIKILFFPKILDKYNNYLIPISSIIIFALISLIAGPLPFIINFILLAFVTWGLMFAITVNRKYFYLGAITFLVITPILILLKMNNFAEYSAVFAFLLLTGGVFNDIFKDYLIKPKNEQN